MNIQPCMCPYLISITMVQIFMQTQNVLHRRRSVGVSGRMLIGWNNRTDEKGLARAHWGGRAERARDTNRTPSDSMCLCRGREGERKGVARSSIPIPIWEKVWSGQRRCFFFLFRGRRNDTAQGYPTHQRQLFASIYSWLIQSTRYDNWVVVWVS